MQETRVIFAKSHPDRKKAVDAYVIMYEKLFNYPQSSLEDSALYRQRFARVRAC